MVGVIWHENNMRFNVLMSDGTTSPWEYTKKKEIKMNQREQIAKISVYQPNDYDHAHGFRFYNTQGAVVLEVGADFTDNTKTDF